MASIKDAIEECYHDEMSFLKFVIYGIPVFFLYNMLVNGGGYIISLPFVAVLLFGFMLQCSYNVRNSCEKVLPSFNFLSVLWSGIKGFVALGPLMFGAYFLELFIYSMLIKYLPDSAVLKVLIVLTGAVCSSIVYTGYMIYIQNFKIIEAYNLKLISDSCVEVLFAVFFMCIQLFVANIIFVLPIMYVIWVFFGFPNPIAIFYLSMVLVFNIAIIGHYFAQVAYEAIKEEEI